jgi:hypothetical protein
VLEDSRCSLLVGVLTAELGLEAGSSGSEYGVADVVEGFGEPDLKDGLVFLGNCATE